MTLARRYVERNKQTRSWFNPLNGNFYSEASKLRKLGESATFKDAIAACDTDMLYMLPATRGTYIDPRSTYPTKLDWEGIDGLIVKAWYRDNAGTLELGEKRIDIHPIGRWFNLPDGIYLSDVILGMEKLRELLEKHFQPIEVTKGKREEYRVDLQSTPARTGIDLLRRKLPYGARYQNLPSDIEHIIMTEFSQARIELFSHDGIDQIERASLYDGRWMYASCLRHVPVGEIIHDYENTYLPYVAGFYRVRVTVPSNWCHIGLLPLKNPKGRGSLYPNQPNETFISWCSDKELKLALDHSWQCEVLERILWPQTQAKGVKIGQDPLRHWGETLVKLREEIALTYKEPFRSLLRDGFRNILLSGIGTLHRSQKGSKYGVDGYAESLADLPDGEFTIEGILPDGSVHYTTHEQLTGYQLESFQPHWPLYVWCQAKVKVTKAALAVPYENLLAIRTDGVWTTCRVPFEDTGKVGCFREKELVCTGPFAWPKNNDELVSLMRIAKGEE